MKKVIFITGFIVFSSLTILAQNPPPPPANPSGSGNAPVGGGAPVGSGLVILLALGAVYGGKKVWEWRKVLSD